MSKLLTEAQIRAFREDGFVFPLDGLTTDEAVDARAKFEAYEAEIGESAHKRLRVKAHLAFPWLTDIARHPRILDAVEDVLGPNILLYLCTLWFKNAHDGGFVSWHQDSPYYGLVPHEEATVWLAFTESAPENGCVRVLPGSHKGPDLDHVETYDPDNLLSRGQTIEGIDVSNAVDMILQPGQFSIHHERLVHGSNANESDMRRMGVSFIYVPTHVRSEIGRRPAMLVRGVDEYGYWDADPEPRFDLDPICLAHLEKVRAGYTDPSIKQEKDRAGA